MYICIHSHPDGTRTSARHSALYDLESNTATYGPASCNGPALQFLINKAPSGAALLCAPIEIDPLQSWIMRCDRVDFPPGGIAYRHTHPGPGIRCLVFGEITIDANGHKTNYTALKPWFENGPDPVLATASQSEPSAFVRVMLLPAQWRGRRTITYIDRQDEGRPKLQSATVFFDQDIDL